MEFGLFLDNAQSGYSNVKTEASMTLDLGPEVGQQLETLASAQGISVEEYLQQLLEKELPTLMAEAASPNESGMVWEDGLFIYAGESPLPAGFLDNALRLSREDRNISLTPSPRILR